MRSLCLALFLFLGACGDCRYSVPENADERIVARAREIVLASDLALTARERDIVLNQRPDTRFYDAFGPCTADKLYIIEWRMGGEMIQVHGIGNVFEQDGAEAKRVSTEYGKGGGG